MSPSVAGPPLSVIRLTGAMARRHGWWRDRHARLAGQPGPVVRPAGGTGLDLGLLAPGTRRKLRLLRSTSPAP